MSIYSRVILALSNRLDFQIILGILPSHLIALGVTMNERERRERARFWARLASVQSLKEISETELETLRAPLDRELAAAIGIPARQLREGSPELAALEMAVPIFQRNFRERLEEAHTRARAILPGIVERSIVDVQRPGPYVWRRGRDGRIEETTILESSDHIASALTQVVLGSRDLFGKCSQCGAIFVRIRRQKYCSPNCTSKALEGARRLEKARYMRGYRRRRTNARNARTEK